MLLKYTLNELNKTAEVMSAVWPLLYLLNTIFIYSKFYIIKLQDMRGNIDVLVQKYNIIKVELEIKE